MKAFRERIFPLSALIAIVTAVFGQCLSFGFVGDDGVLIENNPFYCNLSNVAQIFSPAAYSTNPDDVFNQTRFASGSVAYRPVLSLTYFLDHALWGLNPSGYHVQNLVWHLMNVVLVYALVASLFSSGWLAFVAALLFGIHPLQVEAVCGIGYRADLLAVFFLLAALGCFLRGKMASGKKAVPLFAAAAFLFAGALFSKESAAVFPLLLLLLDWPEVMAKTRKRYFAIVFILGFYLGLYGLVFRNQALAHVQLMGSGVFTHAGLALKILGHYVTAFLLPWSVKALPPVFPAEVSTVLSNADWLGLAALVAAVALAVKKFPSRELRFGLAWFLIAYLPVSNLMPLVSPLAYRFFYLPSVGLCVAAACGFQVFGEKIFGRYKNYLVLLVAVVCGLWSFCLAGVWKSNYIFAQHMIHDFPHNPRGHLLVGLELMARHDAKTALEEFEVVEHFGMSDPRLLFFSGVGHEGLGRRDKAKEYFARGIVEFPSLYHGYAGLGRCLLFEGETVEALGLLYKAFSIKPSYAVTGYLIQVLRLSGEVEEAGRILEAAKKTLAPEKFSALEKIMAMDVAQLPVYIGY